MTDKPRGGRRYYALLAPRGWLGRIAFVLVAAALAALAFFFMVVFLVAGTIFAAGLLLRWWWLVRKVRRAQAAHNIEGEYVVVPSADDAPGARQHEQPRALPDDGSPR